MPTRREFLSSATVTLLVIPLAGCGSSDSPKREAVEVGGLPDGGVDNHLPDAATTAPADGGGADGGLDGAGTQAADGSVADGAGEGGGASCDGIGETSTAVADPLAAGQLHTHTICVPKADLMNPPGDGATYTTSTDLSHEHTVVLTQAELQSLQMGGLATAVTSNVAGHQHQFSFVVGH